MLCRAYHAACRLIEQQIILPRGDQSQGPVALSVRRQSSGSPVVPFCVTLLSLRPPPAKRGAFRTVKTFVRPSLALPAWRTFHCTSTRHCKSGVLQSLNSLSFTGDPKVHRQMGDRTTRKRRERLGQLYVDVRVRDQMSFKLHRRIWRNRSAEDTWSAFLSKIGGHAVPRRSLELYLSEYDKDKKEDNKFDLGNDISEIFKWAEGGSLMFTWMADRHIFHTLACDPAVVARLDADLSDSAIVKTVPNVREESSSVRDVQTGITTITKSPVTYDQWLRRHGDIDPASLTMVTADLLNGLSAPLGLDVPPDVPSMIYLKRTDDARVFEWAFRGEVITKIVPKHTYDEYVDAASQGGQVPFTAGALPTSGFENLEQTAIPSQSGCESEGGLSSC